MKAKLKVYDFVIGQLKLAMRARDAEERLAALQLEIELGERMERLKRGEPEFAGVVPAEELPMAAEGRAAYARGGED